MILRVLGSIQLTDQSVFPSSLQIEIENRPKLARTKLMTVPSSHSIFRVVPSQPYFVRRSKPEKNKEFCFIKEKKRYRFVPVITDDDYQNITVSKKGSMKWQFDFSTPALLILIIVKQRGEIITIDLN